MVLRNLLKHIKKCSSNAYPILKIVIPYVLLMGGIYEASQQVGTIRKMLTAITSFLLAPLSSSISIPAEHPLNSDVLAWLATHGLAKSTRHLALLDQGATGVTYDEDEEDHVVELDDPGDIPCKETTTLNYIPNFGKYRFRHDGHFMSMERKHCLIMDTASKSIITPDPTLPQMITLECFPTLHGTKPIKHFLKHVQGLSNPVKENMTTVYRPSSASSWSNSRHDSWIGAITRPARSLESVALEDSKTRDLVKGIRYYLTPECQRFYANRGYPYRLGFLFYGPPGTGKTSFSVALAGHFGLNVYILSMSDESMTDQRLESLFAMLPSRCIVLLEDVDSAGLERELTKDELMSRYMNSQESRGLGGGGYKSFSKFAKANAKGSPLTLSGLLNCLDGPTSKDGRIVCMTSNAPDNLDPALVRPGRCDQKVLFGYASEEICVKLFTHLYTKTPEELLQGEISVSDQCDIDQLAKDFASFMPFGSKISPAEVQGYLMLHREDPVAAVEGARKFAEEIIEIKAKGKNVAAHANEIPAKPNWKPRRRSNVPLELSDQEDDTTLSSSSQATESEKAEDEEEENEAEKWKQKRQAMLRYSEEREVLRLLEVAF